MCYVKILCKHSLCQVCMKVRLCFFQLTKEYELQAGEATPTPSNIQYWKLHVQQMSNFPMNIIQIYSSFRSQIK